MSVLIAMLAYGVVGLVVVESLRIWAGLGTHNDGDFIIKVLFWPLLLLIAPFVDRDHQQ